MKLLLFFLGLTAISAVETRSQKCCRAMTVKCMACASGMNPVDYCKKNSDSAMCKKWVKKNLKEEEDKMCCMAMTVDCLACAADVTPQDYCKLYHVDGCEAYADKPAEKTLNKDGELCGFDLDYAPSFDRGECEEGLQCEIGEDWMSRCRKTPTKFCKKYNDCVEVGFNMYNGTYYHKDARTYVMQEDEDKVLTYQDGKGKMKGYWVLSSKDKEMMEHSSFVAIDILEDANGDPMQIEWAKLGIKDMSYFDELTECRECPYPTRKPTEMKDPEACKGQYRRDCETMEKCEWGKPYGSRNAQCIDKRSDDSDDPEPIGGGCALSISEMNKRTNTTACATLPTSTCRKKYELTVVTGEAMRLPCKVKGGMCMKDMNCMQSVEAVDSCDMSRDWQRSTNTTNCMTVKTGAKCRLSYETKVVTGDTMMAPCNVKSGMCLADYSCMRPKKGRCEEFQRWGGYGCTGGSSWHLIDGAPKSELDCLHSCDAADMDGCCTYYKESCWFHKGGKVSIEKDREGVSANCGDGGVAPTPKPTTEFPTATPTRTPTYAPTNPPTNEPTQMPTGKCFVTQRGNKKSRKKMCQAMSQAQGCRWSGKGKGMCRTTMCGDLSKSGAFCRQKSKQFDLGCVFHPTDKVCMEGTYADLAGVSCNKFNSGWLCKKQVDKMSLPRCEFKKGKCKALAKDCTTLGLGECVDSDDCEWDEASLKCGEKSKCPGKRKGACRRETETCFWHNNMCKKIPTARDSCRRLNGKNSACKRAGCIYHNKKCL